MKTKLFLLVFLLIIIIQFSCTQENSLKEREQLFNTNWKFIREDIKGAEKADFDDSEW